MSEPNYFESLHDPRDVLRRTKRAAAAVEPDKPALPVEPRQPVRSPLTERDQQVLALFDTHSTLTAPKVAQLTGMDKDDARASLRRIGARGLARLEPHDNGSNAPGVWRRA